MPRGGTKKQKKNETQTKVRMALSQNSETLRVRNVVDATRFGVHGCEPGRVSDGSRLALC